MLIFFQNKTLLSLLFSSIHDGHLLHFLTTSRSKKSKKKGQLGPAS